MATGEEYLWKLIGRGNWSSFQTEAAAKRYRLDTGMESAQQRVHQAAREATTLVIL